MKERRKKGIKEGREGQDKKEYDIITYGIYKMQVIMQNQKMY